MAMAERAMAMAERAMAKAERAMAMAEHAMAKAEGGANFNQHITCEIIFYSLMDRGCLKFGYSYWTDVILQLSNISRRSC
jgi:hypothetical protein